MLDRVSMGEGGRLSFWCPGCDEAHTIRYEARDAPVWSWDGDMVEPTIEPSIFTERGPGTRCHSFVRDGKIQFLVDSEHALASQTVDLPEWPTEV